MAQNDKFPFLIERFFEFGVNKIQEERQNRSASINDQFEKDVSDLNDRIKLSLRLLVIPHTQEEFIGIQIQPPEQIITVLPQTSAPTMIATEQLRKRKFLEELV